MRSRFFEWRIVFFGKPVPTFPRHALIRPRIASSVDQQILAGDETGMFRAQKRAIGAELRRSAVALGRIGRCSLAPDLIEALVIQALAPRLQHAADMLALGIAVE